MVQVTQTDEEIKIVIELNRLLTRKPDIILLPKYIKFNNPPIFFERHLTKEVDEAVSFCRIFKNEARIVLIKKEKGIWAEVFEKLSKEELFKKRLEIADKVSERNKEKDKHAIERYEQKKRTEIEKEINRETAMRERVKQFEENACREALLVGVRKEAHTKPIDKPVSINRNPHVNTPTIRPLAAARIAGKINVSFSKCSMQTPKRESQNDIKLPFTIEENNQSVDGVD